MFEHRRLQQKVWTPGKSAKTWLVLFHILEKLVCLFGDPLGHWDEHSPVPQCYHHQEINVQFHATGKLEVQSSNNPGR